MRRCHPRRPECQRPRLQNADPGGTGLNGSTPRRRIAQPGPLGPTSQGTAQGTRRLPRSVRQHSLWGAGLGAAGLWPWLRPRATSTQGGLHLLVAGLVQAAVGHPAQPWEGRGRLGHLHVGAGQTRLRGSPAPGLTCPTAHRAGPPNGGPHPGLPLLRLEVGEGDVGPGEVAVLLTIAPVDLCGTDGRLQALRGGLPEGGCPRHLPRKPSPLRSCIPVFFGSAGRG